MDIEAPSIHTAQSAGESTSSRIRIVKSKPVELPDRGLRYEEIGIKVQVFNPFERDFYPTKVYFINPDIKIGEMNLKMRKDFDIIDRDNFSQTNRHEYHLFFENIKLSESSRFAEMRFVTGDRFKFCPSSEAPRHSSPILAEYMSFMFKKETKNVVTEETQFFSMSRNNYQLKPPIVELSRMNYYQLGNLEGFSIQNEHGRIDFLQPVDIR